MFEMRHGSFRVRSLAFEDGQALRLQYTQHQIYFHFKLYQRSDDLIMIYMIRIPVTKSDKPPLLSPTRKNFLCRIDSVTP